MGERWFVGLNISADFSTGGRWPYVIIYSFYSIFWKYKILMNFCERSDELLWTVEQYEWCISNSKIQIQNRHLHAPTYKLSRWRARRTKITRLLWARWKCQEKVSFQLSFKTVQRKIRVTQMHWECVPGCGRSKVESARTYNVLVFVRGIDSDRSSVTDDLSRACTVAGEIGQVMRSDRVRAGICIPA